MHRIRNLRLRISVLLASVLVAGVAHAQSSVATEVLLQRLMDQGIPGESVLGVDGRGVPIVCSSEKLVQEKVKIAEAKPPQNPPPPTIIPLGMRSWECIPGVIRMNRTDTFRVEVDANGSVSNVQLVLNSSQVEFVAGPGSQPLRDDGLNGDRVPEDRIYTSGPLHYNGSYVPSHFQAYTNSPVGIYFGYVGDIWVTETTGVSNRFLISPEVGLLNTNIAMVESVQLSSNVVLTPYLANVKGTNRQTQISVRASMSGLRNLTMPVYSVLPDAFDFFNFFSMDHVEYIGDVTSPNFIAGAHLTVQVNYTGTGKGLQADMPYFGGGSRLLGLNCLDTVGRGVWSYNLLHEITHQWASFTSTSLGLNRGDSHYNFSSSVNSPVGGQPWRSTNGMLYLDCFESASTARSAPPLDKYMMGLIPAPDVSPLYVYTNGATCFSPVSNYFTRTISEIQAVHGIRTPTPATAHKDFRLGFVAESYARWLTPVELTFYDILAGHVTKTIPQEDEAPRIMGWVPIGRYFGEGSTWSSDVLGRVRPAITRIERLPNGSAQVFGTGYPGRNYRLLRSTNSLLNWVSVTNVSAGTNGVFLLPDTLTTALPRFYRVATP